MAAGDGGALAGPPLPLRTEYTLAAQFAMRSAVQAADLAFEIAGVSSRSPLT